MISRGMERASVSLLSEMDERSKLAFIVITDCTLTLAFIRFGYAFLMETGSSVGEIMGHNKVNRVHFHCLRLLTMYPRLLMQFLCDQTGLSGLQRAETTGRSCFIMVRTHNKEAFPLRSMICRSTV